MSKRKYKGKAMSPEEMEINKAIGKKIKAARLARNFTQTKVANKIFVTFQQIQKYEKGKNGVSAIKLLQFSKILDEPIEYFIDDLNELLAQVKPANNNPDIVPKIVTGLN